MMNVQEKKTILEHSMNRCSITFRVSETYFDLEIFSSDNTKKLFVLIFNKQNDIFQNILSYQFHYISTHVMSQKYISKLSAIKSEMTSGDSC